MSEQVLRNGNVMERSRTRTITPVSYTHLDVYKRQLEAVSVGDVVDVRVIGVDLRKKRISLSMKGTK